MAAPTVYENVAPDLQLEDVGTLFAGKKFWVAQRVPSRKQLLDDIHANGGEVVKLEKKADYMIADHYRKDCPPGTISYEFVTKSIKDGSLRDPADHRVGPPLGESREPGAINRPAKGTRAAYTAEEDRILYKWVRDCEASGRLASGNEIYKQLEAKYPRHTWQSWRDRYLKQLRTCPPSGYNIPDNAPPSPPSDTLPEQTAAVPTVVRSGQDTASKEKQKQKQKQEQVPAPSQASAPDQVKDESPKPPTLDYTVEQLAATFTTEDWEELYGFAEEIENSKVNGDYTKAWEAWAEAQDNQTAVQWRQYYEKVVHPQWLRDPEWKKKKIKRKMEEKYQKQPSPSEEADQQQGQGLEDKPKDVAATSVPPTAQPAESTVFEDERYEEERLNHLLTARRNKDEDSAAYHYYADENKGDLRLRRPELNYKQVHEILMAQWDLLSAQEKSPYVAMDRKITKRAHVNAAKLSSEVKLMSSSTMQHESPQYIKEIYQNVLKRVRGDDIGEEEEAHEEPSPAPKRLRSTSPVARSHTAQSGVTGSQKEQIEIASSKSSVSNPQDAYDDVLARDQIMADMDQNGDGYNIKLDEDDVNIKSEVDSDASDDFPNIGQFPPPPEGLEEPSEDDLPSDSPTPRASRKRANNFDTQAILSSPSQGLGIDRLPQPIGVTKDLQTQREHRSSSLAPHPDSEASTTQSLHEFRRSLNSEDNSQPIYQALPRAPSLSPAPSATSMSTSASTSTSTSTDSGDPDPPLTASEQEDFFAHFNDLGFSDDFITAALKRTRQRPELAEVVLDAWKEGKPLPIQRGIWSLDDDEAAERGDAVELERLARKHTIDGWGGITERLKFLDMYRRR